jgi:hypothetical protein
MTVEETNKLEWERVDPFMIYPAPWARSTDDAPLIERHRLSRADLSALKGIEGYSTEAIDKVLVEYGIGGLHDWLSIDSSKAQAEGRSTINVTHNNDLIDALQYWGSVSGKMLQEWGMSPQEVPDQAAEYEVEAWLIGPYVIKAVINQDPLARRPYYMDAVEKIPGAFWGNSLFDQMSDLQNMCNAAARALANNMGIASGPLTWVNIERIPAGEEITQLYPWKVFQGTSDPMGSSAKPIEFFQPNSNAQELMAIYEKFSMLADEYTGIPRYMTGIEGTPGLEAHQAGGVWDRRGNPHADAGASLLPQHALRRGSGSEGRRVHRGPRRAVSHAEGSRPGSTQRVLGRDGESVRPADHRPGRARGAVADGGADAGHEP